jgi:hypothetical protein
VEGILYRTSWSYPEDLVIRRNSSLLSSWVQTCNMLFWISLKLLRVRVELGYNQASSIVTCVPLEKLIVALPDPTIFASHSGMVKTSLDL